MSTSTPQTVAGAITPMPGGAGPMTIGCLMENTFNAACGCLRLTLDQV